MNNSYLQKKIVIITNGNYFSRLFLEELLVSRSELIAGILIIKGDYKARVGVHSLVEVSKVTTKPYLIHKLFIIASFLVAQRLYPYAAFSVKARVREIGVPILEVRSVNSEEAISWVASFIPDLLVSVSCPQYIRTEMLNTARLGGINIHAAALPKYGGIAPNYWVLSNGDKVAGTTVHFINEKFDEGNILVQKVINISLGESAFHLFRRLAILGRGLLVEGVDMALSGIKGEEQDLENSTYYSHPDFASYKNLKKKGHKLVSISELYNTLHSELNGSYPISSIS
jgi:folate-dependent phosphoribosylglycinamide formyltransferase PurN